MGICAESEDPECKGMMGKEKPDNPEIILKRPLTSFQKNKSDLHLILLNVVLILLIIVLFAALITVSTSRYRSCDLNNEDSANTTTPEIIDIINEKSAPCEDYWIWHRGKCYYFSTERDTWRNSEKFCHSHNSSLAIIDNKEELDFLFRYKGLDNHWIGLRRTDDNTGWTWTNGESYNESLFNIRRSSPENIEFVYLNYKHVESDGVNLDFKWICSKS